MELPKSFMPKNNDNEVEDFVLLPVTDAIKMIHETDKIKPSAVKILLDFLIRKGYVNFESGTENFHNTVG